MAYLWVGLGGLLGAMARFQVGLWLPSSTQSADGNAALAGIPLATLSVNVLGSFFIGFLAFVNISGAPLPDHARLFLITGLLGGFTTFSAFSLETLNLLEIGAFAKAFGNVVLNVLICLLGVWLGASLARLLAS